MADYAKYFVAYAFYMPDGQEGWGNATVNRALPVTEMKDVQSMTAAIQKQEPRLAGAQIQIINWRRFEKPGDR